MALVAHPDDARYQPLFGKDVQTPLFGVRVPVKPHPLADPEKGSGIAMICTFGDVTDVVWWRELSLPVRAIIQPNGTLRPVTWGEHGWESVERACGTAAIRPAGRVVRVEGTHAHCRAAARVGRPHRGTAAHHPRGEVLREGAIARWRS